MRARVCECVCLIASLLFFSSLPVRLPASVPHPRSLTHRQRGRARETHTHSHTHAHAHAGYMNGRREPILRDWVSRGAQALGAGPHHGAGGRHAGDAPPPAATHQPLGSPASLLSPMSFSRLPLSLLLLRFFLYSFLFFLEFSKFSQFSIFLGLLLPSLLAFSPPFSNFLFPYPDFLCFLSSCLLFSFLPLWLSLPSLCSIVSSPLPPPFTCSRVSLGCVASLPAYPLMLFLSHTHTHTTLPGTISLALLLQQSQS